MDRSEAIEIIAKAAQWLTTSPGTRFGRSQGRTYLVREAIATADYQAGTRGIYFGHDMYFSSDGKLDTRTGLYLIDHGNPASYKDFVPVTPVPQKNDVPLWCEGRSAVDMRLLNTFSEEILVRMANNVTKIMKEYGHA